MRCLIEISKGKKWIAFALAGLLVLAVGAVIGHSTGRASRNGEVSALRVELSAITAERDDYRLSAERDRDLRTVAAGLLAAAGRDAQGIRDVGSRIVILSRGIREAIYILDPGILEKPITESK